MKGKRAKIPVTVLERAKEVAQVTPPRRSAPRAPATSKGQRASATRQKLVAALKKLHPMD